MAITSYQVSTSSYCGVDDTGYDWGTVDSDGDGLCDGYETGASASNPYKKDTDGDGVSDYDEVQAGTDPSYHPSP